MSLKFDNNTRQDTVSGSLTVVIRQLINRLPRVNYNNNYFGDKRATTIAPANYGTIVDRTRQTQRNDNGIRVEVAMKSAKQLATNDNVDDGSCRFTEDGDSNCSGDFFVEKGQLVRKHGINWIIAALFIVADMAGGGIVALPTAIVRCSFYLGIFLLLVMALLATSSSIMLGKAWVILLRQYPIYRTHCRKPFAEMGYRALGPRMKSIVSICLNVTQFGASTVFLILIAKNTSDFFSAVFQFNISMCLMILVVALLILPITLLKSPQDFWPVVVFGMVTTGIAVLFVCVGALRDRICFNERHMPALRATNVLLALGTIMFSYGGHSALPTIQHDMRRPSDFGKSSVLAFSLITIMNLIAVLFGALTYGDSLGDSVINSIQTTWIQQAINVMILAHCLLTFTLIINPLNQEVEELFSVPQGFTTRRVIVRVGIMAAAVLTATTMPTFGPIISVIGALAFLLISMIFPCLFYLYLSASEKQRQYDNGVGVVAVNNTNGAVNKSALAPIMKTAVIAEPEYCALTLSEVITRTKPKILLLCGIICCIGSMAAAIATCTSIHEIVTSEFETPCYVRLFSSTANATANVTQVEQVTHCCGEHLNITMEGIRCTARKSDFYT